MMSSRRKSAIGLFIIALCLSAPAFAVDRLDLVVGLKVLPLLTNKISGVTVAAVIYDSANAESRAEARAIKDIIDNDLQPLGGVKLKGVLVGSAELDKLLGAKIAFLAHGLSPAALDATNKAMLNAGILTITTDLDYVKANKCVLGIVSRPSVRIYYSKVAAEEENISFAQAFTMLVDQI